MSGLLSMIGLGLTAAVLAVMLRSMRTEYAVLLSLGAGVILLFWMIDSLAPILEQLVTLIESTRLAPEYGGVLIKALGISYITQLASDACKDAGEGAIGAKLELCGRVTIILLSLPMFAELLSIAGTLFSI